MMAAEIINMRHGWQQPLEIRDMRKEEIADFCEYTLQKMQEFDIDFYFKMFRMKGYDVTPRYDKSKNLLATPLARMLQYSRLLKSVESSWYHSLKPHGRSSIRSLLKLR